MKLHESELPLAAANRYTDLKTLRLVIVIHSTGDIYGCEQGGSWGHVLKCTKNVYLQFSKFS